MKPVILTLSLLLLASTAQARSVRSDIDAANQKFGAAYAKGDPAAIARLYTEHATIFPPGSDMVQGREGVQKVWSGMIQGGMKVTGLHTVSVEQYGDAAREIGRFSADMPNAQQGVDKLEGKYVVVWKRVKGAWMLDSDIWNLNR